MAGPNGARAAAGHFQGLQFAPFAPFAPMPPMQPMLPLQPMPAYTTGGSWSSSSSSSSGGGTSVSSSVDSRGNVIQTVVANGRLFVNGQDICAVPPGVSVSTVNGCVFVGSQRVL
eukprot:gnl/Hemi2/8124_TR2796_c0_g2_i1.p2 gnl/Hemi2/8124_TR2796_c0_g2~~gnl/Hemi2/8124_TR2796_c0_g2_i1.p2  ORF type:complete len:115 (+),score=20.39 gnl/Hemi2/8124_TR2796_c0_g2_i1:139-483(+)